MNNNTVLGSDASWFRECSQVIVELAPEIYNSCNSLWEVIEKKNPQSSETASIPPAESTESSLSKQLLSQSASVAMHALISGGVPIPGAFVKDAECGSWRHLYRTTTAVQSFLDQTNANLSRTVQHGGAADVLSILIRRLLAVQSCSLVDQTAAFVVKRNNNNARANNNSILRSDPLSQSQIQDDSQALFESSMRFFLLDQLGRLIPFLCALSSSK